MLSFGDGAESAKAGGIAALSGSLAAAPVKASALLASNSVISAAMSKWEFSTLALAVQLALFGVVYRYAVRSDDNDRLKQFAVVAFAMCRALSSTQVYKYIWTPDMYLQLGAYFGESVLAFGWAAAALEFAWKKGYARRVPTYDIMPPFYRDDLPPPYYGDRDALPPTYYDGDQPPYY
jgi:hypothetical protein